MDNRRGHFERLYRRHVGEVAAYVARRADRQLVQDVVADTFLVAWRRLDDVPDDTLPWLYAVARKTLANHRRSSSRQRSLLERLRSAPAPPPHLDDTELASALA